MVGYERSGETNVLLMVLHLNVPCGGQSARNRLTVLPQPFQVQPDSLANVGFGVGLGVTGRHASGEIGHVRRVVPAGGLWARMLTHVATLPRATPIRKAWPAEISSKITPRDSRSTT